MQGSKNIKLKKWLSFEVIIKDSKLFLFLNFEIIARQVNNYSQKQFQLNLLVLFSCTIIRIKLILKFIELDE
jgi:hypothetical protein